jgi:uncharacterized protein (DUF362 family)/Pyruvate/2-oxoacid:ferredoxin oxidoreductase delta subunit
MSLAHLIQYGMHLVIVRQSSYEYERLRRDVFDILSGINDGLVGRGTRVLIKPNLLAASTPEQAIVTHPLVVKAACEYALELGAQVTVGDSPPMGAFEKIVNSTGLRKTLHGMPVNLKELQSPMNLPVGESFREVELSEDALGAEAIINLPKLKTHSQMNLTLAVKNLFGCVVGVSKGEWHLRVGDDRKRFAELLVSIYKTLPPSISLMDGIIAMEGNGPGTGGTPRELGVLLGSRNAPALDEAVCKMVGYKPSSLLTNKIARGMGLTEKYTVEGNLPSVMDFAIPEETGVMFGPKFFSGFLRRHLTVSPACVDETCKLCEECTRMCPAGALEMRDRKLRFDYDRCIRCYCCLEVCPHGALTRRDPLLRRVLRKFF